MKRILKWVGIALGVVLIVLIVAGIVLNLDTSNRLNKTYAVEAEPVSIPTDDEALARGEFLAHLICVECHGDDLSGNEFVDEAGIVTLYGANLTPGRGGIGDMSDSELVLAIRHGIQPDGKPLIIMPAEIFINWSAEDIGAVIAYLRSLPPIDNDVPEPEVTIIGRALVGLGLFGKPFPAEYIDHERAFPEMPEVSANEAYGAYLSRAVACTLCHGDNLAGGVQPPNMPPGEIPESANLTPAGDLADWSQDDFFLTLRTGTTPDDHTIDPDHMPWDMYARLNDVELQALWLYIQSLPPAESAAE